MRASLTILFFVAASMVAAQTSLKDLRKKSHQVMVFTTTAADAEKFITNDSIPLQAFEKDTPAYILPADSFDLETLPIGHYVLVSIMENEIVAQLAGVSNLLVYPVNNRYNIQLEVRKKDGAFVNDARVWANGRQARFHQQAKTYWLQQKRLDEAFIRIYAPGDTLLMQLDVENENPVPVWKQRWRNLKSTKVGRAITWAPVKLVSLLKKRSRYNRQTKMGDGYVLFNQPKYKLTDTVKLKAYLVNKRRNRFKEKLEVWLEYRTKGKSHQQLLTRLAPASPGSYVYAFPLSDTLVSDIRYTVSFKNTKGQRIIAKTFSTEDYVLDEIGAYSFRSVHKRYYAGDSMIYYASAKDANGLSLLDGRAQLVLTTKSINNFYEDSMYVPDTLYTESKPLDTQHETVFTIAAGKLPHANIAIQASLLFRNSNNEVHEETTTVTYLPVANDLEVTTIKDSVYAVYKVNGKPATGTATVQVEGDLVDKTMQVELPAALKIDPLAETYRFRVIRGNDTIVAAQRINEYYQLPLTRVSKGDTVGFVLNNTFKIPVTYLVLHNNAVLAAGKSNDDTIRWQKQVTNKRHMYVVKWQYMWAGKMHERTDNIGLLYKLLKVEMQHNPIVYPGQKDSITIAVADYKNRPAEGVNLAAVAYNTQFKKDIDVREPPYLVKYKNRQSIIRSTHEIEEAYTTHRYKLGDYKQWMSRFGTDTMQYYKMLFPVTTPLDVVSPISEFIPQVSVHVVKDGRPQEIYLLYINRQLVYYNGVTDKMKYAYPAMQGYTQVACRLYNKYVQIDSIYVQPFYKHDIIIDIDKLPATAIIKDMPAYWTGEERNVIENSIWQLDNNYKTSLGYVWQESRVVKLNGYQSHLVGPFVKNYPLQFYAPGDFDINFRFEPGYLYNLSKNISRLERRPVFGSPANPVPLPKVHRPVWVLGDTLVPPPVIQYSPAVLKRYINVNGRDSYADSPRTGQLQFTVKSDTAISLEYVILVNDSSSNVHYGTTRRIRNIKPGKYTLLLVNKDFRTAQLNNIVIRADETFCIHTEAESYYTGNSIVEELVRKSMAPVSRVSSEAIADTIHVTHKPLPKGSSSISGIITDANGGHGIPGASVMIAGTGTGTNSSTDGSFSIVNIKEGHYTIRVASVGYNSRDIEVNLSPGETSVVIVKLTVSTQHLEEVVVTGYGNQKRRELTGAVMSIKSSELSTSFYSDQLGIQGKLAGVDISSQEAGGRIMIRGIAGAYGDAKPLYVIDGILYDELPAHIKPGMITSMEVLKDAAATALYGSRAAAGAIVITTGAKAVRSVFRDYAVWQPELTTNAAGKAIFIAEYPDNITGWELYVLAMDKHLRMGKGTSFTQAFKPVAAQLNTPQFFVQGDSVDLIGKALNHTGDAYNITTSFKLLDKLVRTQTHIVAAKQSINTSLPVVVNTLDTVEASFSLNASTGFSDGEERKIPVFRQGVEESQGAFFAIQADTTVTFTPKFNGELIVLYAHNNTLDVLLDEIDHLKEYPFYCMEQTASKLKGLLMERKIMQLLKRDFKHEQEIRLLLKKLQGSQLYDGGWSWWEKGNPDVYISTYVIDALLQLQQDPLVQTNVRNGLLFLQNRLPYLKGDALLGALNTLSKAGHIIDYKPYISKVNFDSLTQHQQWLWIQVTQKQGLEYKARLQQMVQQSISTMTGGMHWGSENYRWYSNHVATTVVAFQVLQQEQSYAQLLPKIVQYFLENRQHGYYRNTVESASIVSAILPYLTRTNKEFNEPAKLAVNADSSFSVSSFPYKAKLPASTRPVVVSKSGGGLTYVTLYQKWWNPAPVSVDDKFRVTSAFKQDGQTIATIPAGEKVKMTVHVQVLADAEYVMVEMPIPSGCNYSTKSQQWGTMHREYFKNKVVLFAETLRKGDYNFEIELEPRYKGTFMLNPAKVELMYFPTFYGRNEMNKVNIS